MEGVASPETYSIDHETALNEAPQLQEATMFGRRNTGRRQQGGALNSSNLRKAAIAGVGMLALRWWRNRQSSSRTSRPGESASSTQTGQTDWS